MFTGVAAVVIAYVIGSIPSAYIATRVLTGEDIRRLGGGNSGASNVYEQVNKSAAVVVCILDMAKGAAAVAIAYWGLDVSQPFVLAAGVAVVVGHIWSVFLKFSGGNGLATTIGVLAILMTWEVLIGAAVALLLRAFTRNLILSTNIALLAVPISAWLLDKDLVFIVYPFIIVVVLVLNFLPTAKAAILKAGSKENLEAELLRRKEDRK